MRDGEAPLDGIHTTTISTPEQLPLQHELAGPGSDTDDDGATVATRTDDDLVGDAVRHVLGAFEAEDEDDDYDEIVWNITYVIPIFPVDTTTSLYLGLFAHRKTHLYFPKVLLPLSD